MDREKRNEQLQGITDEFIRRYGGRDEWRRTVQQNPSWARSRLEEYLSQRAKQIGGISAEEQAFIYGYANLPPDTRARLSGINADTKPLASRMRLTATNGATGVVQGTNAQDKKRTARLLADEPRGVMPSPTAVAPEKKRTPDESAITRSLVDEPRLSKPSGVRGGGNVNLSDGGNGMRKASDGGGVSKQQEKQQQNPNNMYPIANVFRDFYGGNVGEAYQWSASDEPVENGSPIRRVHVFRNLEDQQTRFYFEPEGDGNWALKHISGQTIAHGLVYNPKERRFYATNDVTPQQMLQALRQFQAAQATGNGAPSSGGDPNAQRLPGAVQFLDVGNGRYAWVGIDGKLHYGMRANDGTMISERSMPLDQVFNPPQQQAPENSMNWLMTMLPLLLLILARR